MSRNVTDRVHSETPEEWLAGALRQLYSARNAVRYAQRAEERQGERKREERLLHETLGEQQDSGTSEEIVGQKEKDGKRGNGTAKEPSLRKTNTKGQGSGRSEAAAVDEKSRAADKVVKDQARQKVSMGSKPSTILQLLRYSHSRNALMCLVALNKHFRQDRTLWNQTELGKHFLDTYGGVSTRCIAQTEHDLTLQQFASEVIQAMFQMLEGLCRNTPLFDDDDTIKRLVNKFDGEVEGDVDDEELQADGNLERATKTLKRTKPAEGERLSTRNGKRGRNSEIKITKEDLYISAMGDPVEEPRFELLKAALMDEFNDVYCRVYRPDTKPNRLSVYELTFADEILGKSNNDTKAKANKYLKGMLAVANSWAAAARDDPGLSDVEKAIYQQLPSKLRVMLRWSTVNINEMPQMPLLTRSAVHMILMRFALVRNAIQEVSVM
jgi:hypothetical protein